MCTCKNVYKDTLSVSIRVDAEHDSSKCHGSYQYQVK